jgi:hypothetical protein
MSRLTLEERHRVFLDRQQTHDSRPCAPARETIVPVGAPRRARHLAKIATVVLLLAGGVLAYQLLEFHLPASILDLFLP